MKIYPKNRVKLNDISGIDFQQCKKHPTLTRFNTNGNGSGFFKQEKYN